MPEFTDPVRRIEQLLSSSEKEFSAAFLELVSALRSSLDLAALIALLEAGRYGAAWAMVEIGAEAMGAAWTQQFRAAAQSTARFIGTSAGIRFVFDETNVQAYQAMRSNRLRLVVAMQTEQREMVRRIIAEGIQQGMNPKLIAAEIRNSIGLTPYQQQAVSNYRRALQNLDRSALQRALRDKRFDPSLRRALDSGNPLTDAQVERMVERYRERMLRMRSDAIARTESLRSVHEGVRSTYLQAAEQGIIDRSSIKRTWNTSGDDRVRNSHVKMDGQERGMDEMFVSGLGNLLLYPTDPNAPAEDVVQCRCVVAHTFTPVPIPGSVEVVISG